MIRELEQTLLVCTVTSYIQKVYLLCRNPSVVNSCLGPHPSPRWFSLTKLVCRSHDPLSLDCQLR
jgi:hypothetical protein